MRANRKIRPITAKTTAEKREKKVEMFCNFRDKSDGPLSRVMNRVMKTLSGVEIAKTADEADLVLVLSVREIGASYSPDKWYGIVRIAMDKEAQSAYENVRMFDNVGTIVVDMVKYIDDIKKALAERQPAVPTKTEEPEDLGKTPLRVPGLPAVLVVDDALVNRQAAAKQLSQNCNLTVVGNFDDAMDILAKEKFDFALLDLHLPMSPRTLGGTAFKLGELVPYGLLLLLQAGRHGVGAAAIVTDLNHHSDCFSAAFDFFTSELLRVNDSACMLMHAPMVEGVKDWARALEILKRRQQQ